MCPRPAPLVRCSPQDYLFDPTKYDDPAPPAPPLRIREPSFLASARTPAEVKVGVLGGPRADQSWPGSGVFGDGSGPGDPHAPNAAWCARLPVGSRRPKTLASCLPSPTSWSSPPAIPPLPLPWQSSVLVVRPSAALSCSDCVQEAAGADGTPILEVPPGLTDAQLLPLLEPYRRYRVWRLSLEAVGTQARAFGGFADAAAAAAFDERMERMTSEWCCRWVLAGCMGAADQRAPQMLCALVPAQQHSHQCSACQGIFPVLQAACFPLPCLRCRREEELARYHKQGQQTVKLRMNSHFRYSDMAAGRSTT